MSYATANTVVVGAVAVAEDSVLVEQASGPTTASLFGNEPATHGPLLLVPMTLLVT